MDILYQDNEILVCIKPSGTVSEDVPGGLPECIRKIPGNSDLSVYTVHRLDRQTGGIMVYALTNNAAAKLSAQVQSNDFSKEYYAAARGCPETKQGILKDLLFHDVRKNKTYIADSKRKGVKEAVLEYEVLEETGEPESLSLNRIRLITGRTHQIRVQFASRKMPLAGDGRYGSKIKCDLALWACSLSFIHPSSGKQMHFETLPPEIYPWILFEAIRHNDSK